MNCFFNQSDDQSRREFVRLAAKSLLGVGALPLLSQPAYAGDDSASIRFGGNAKSVIYVFLSGGMSHIDTFDTKPGTEAQGPIQSISTSADGIQVSQYFPKLSRQMHHFAVINSMNSTQGAHEQGQYYMHTSYFLRGTIQHPYLGAWSSHHLGKRNQLFPANVRIGGSSDSLGAGFLESKHAAVPIGKPSEGLQHSKLPPGVTQLQFTKRMARLQKMNRTFQSKFNTKQTRAYAEMYDEAVSLMKSRDLDAFDLTKELPRTRERYGNHKFGQACLLAKRLVKKNVRFVEVGQGGWDTHDNNFERISENAANLDDGLSALVGDLSTDGLLDDTLIVVATEFGRTPTIQTERVGRNHYPHAFTCLLAGGGIKGGIRYGKTDEEAREVIEDMVTIPDFNATIARAMGLPIHKETTSPSGRPFKIADQGEPVKALFA